MTCHHVRLGEFLSQQLHEAMPGEMIERMLWNWLLPVVKIVFKLKNRDGQLCCRRKICNANIFTTFDVKNRDHWFYWFSLLITYLNKRLFFYEVFQKKTCYLGEFKNACGPDNCTDLPIDWCECLWTINCLHCFAI